MSIKHYFIVVLVLNITLSCKQEIQYRDKPVDFAITSPKQGWTYYDDTKIMFAINKNTNDITWSSNISGHLGKGNHFAAYLPEGAHIITAEVKNVKKVSSVLIFPYALSDRSILINYSPIEIMLKKGKYNSFLYTNEGTIKNFIFGKEITFPINNNSQSNDNITKNVNQLSRCIHLPVPKAYRYTKDVKRQIMAFDEDNFNDNDTISETTRSFFVVNTVQQLGAPHIIDAVLLYQSSNLSIWFPSHCSIESVIFWSFIRTAETIILPRLELLLGKHADIDGDGRIAILFSETINNENLATGFFNPVDFFARNNNALSDMYNPWSNEMDIIYLAVPNDDYASPFSLQNITATLAHELAHACTFTVKTWNHAFNDNANINREELFLDEGWSHLAENLTGLGISGGNIKFLNRFLENTPAYSFCGANIFGQNDSVGMRGAITLFLSWLFWKSGGISWNENNPVNLIDLGGIAFLQKMLEIPETGWESIGKAYGQPVNILFKEMLDEINHHIKTNNVYNYTIDPVTNEAVDFFVNMGKINVPNSNEIITIGLPNTFAIDTEKSLLSWSCIFFNQFNYESDVLLTLISGNRNGNIFFSYIHTP